MHDFKFSIEFNRKIVKNYDNEMNLEKLKNLLDHFKDGLRIVCKKCNRILYLFIFFEKLKFRSWVRLLRQFSSAHKQTCIIQKTSLTCHTLLCSPIEFRSFFWIVHKNPAIKISSHFFKTQHEKDVLTFDLSKHKKLQNVETPWKLNEEGWMGKGFCSIYIRPHRTSLRLEPLNVRCLFERMFTVMADFFFRRFCLRVL